MKRVFSHPLTAIVIGFFLRLLFLLFLPSTAGDTALYETLSENWVGHRIYGLVVEGVLTPVNIRMPGYPGYLALVRILTDLSGEAARFWVMLGQVFIDLGSCLLIAELAKRCCGRDQNSKRVYLTALWLAVWCPFTANYTAVPLTETLTMFWTTLALVLLVPMVNQEQAVGAVSKWERFARRSRYFRAAFFAGMATGVATLFRPESPLLLLSCLPVVLWAAFLRDRLARGVRASVLAGLGCVLVLLPWTIRNAVTFGEFQPLAPRYTTLPGERAPLGFMSWEKTWLYRLREVFLVSWKMNGDPIEIDDIPSRAFDSPEERQHVAAILERYNQDSNLTAEEDAEFRQIAQARTARDPLRTYLWVPLERAVTLWFTPRVEQLPVSGSVFPLGYNWDRDRLDMCVTIGLFAINVFYVALALCGTLALWRHAPEARAAVVLLASFVLVRTAFLTTIETPEPRYVLVCYPVVLAMAAQALLAWPKRASSR